MAIKNYFLNLVVFLISTRLILILTELGLRVFYKKQYFPTKNSYPPRSDDEYTPTYKIKDPENNIKLDNLNIREKEFVFKKPWLHIQQKLAVWLRSRLKNMYLFGSDWALGKIAFEIESAE